MRASTSVQPPLTTSGEAIADSLGFGPETSSRALGWSNLEMFSWRGEAEHCAYQTRGDLVIVAHIGGAPNVAVEIDRRPNQYQSRPGSLTIVPPETSIAWQVHGGVHSYSLHLAASCFDGVTKVTSKQIGEILQFRCGVQDPILNSLVTALATELAAPTQIGSIYAESLGDCIGLHIARSAMRAQEPTFAAGFSAKTLGAVLDRIEAHLEDGISLQQLADSVHLSRAHFAKLFRQSMGIAPHAYMTGRRIAAAKVMLTCSNRSLCEIALACGFSSQAHFTEQFRRETGQTPARFRSHSG